MRREGTRTVDLHALNYSVASDLADLGHELAVPDPGRALVACRPVELRRALRNLLENVGAHGVRATARIARDDGDLRVVIEDEGPGIPEADLERVFGPFVRLDESRSPARAAMLLRGPSFAATVGTSGWRTVPKADGGRRSPCPEAVAREPPRDPPVVVDNDAEPGNRE